MPGALNLILLGALVVLLAIAVWTDLASRTIPNVLNLIVAALAPVTWWAAGLPSWPDIPIQIGVAALVFAAFTLAFALGMMGGGDVKLITALALWRVPLAPGEPMFAPLMQLLLVMAVAGGALTLAMLVLHRRSGAPGKPVIPYGVAIAAGALASYAERYLNHFG